MLGRPSVAISNNLPVDLSFDWTDAHNGYRCAYLTHFPTTEQVFCGFCPLTIAIRSGEDRTPMGRNGMEMRIQQPKLLHAEAGQLAPKVGLSAWSAGVIALIALLCAGISGCALSGSSATPPPPSNLSITTSSIAPAQQQSSYNAVLSASGGSAPYRWSVSSGSLPNGLLLTSSTGVISGTATQSGSFPFTVQAQDSSSPVQTATHQYTISVSASSSGSSISITTSSMPPGTVGTSYSKTLTASGGTSPYSWTIVSGTLPAGLSLNSSTGTVSGTPSQQGTANFTVKVTDSVQGTAQAAFSIAVSSGTNNTALVITTASLPAAQVSIPYSATLAASNGTAPYTWSLASNSGVLPPGLTLSATSGTISGTPSTASTYNFAIQVSDSSSPKQTATHTFTLSTSGVALDQYGGREDLKCATATGFFHVEKIQSRWWFCTPLGNAFFMHGIYVVATSDSGYLTAIKNKYGDSGPQWSISTNQRMESWGFNTLGIYASVTALPTAIDNRFPLDTQGLHSQPVKMPFIMVVRPALYSMENPAISTINFTNEKLLTEPVKDMFAGLTPFYTDFRPANGVADYFDSKMDAWLAKDLSVSMVFNQIVKSPYFSYAIGVGADDGDEMYGFGAGDALPTQPGGHNNPNLSWLVATMSPIQTANSKLSALYADTTVYTKKAWHDMLIAKYGTISALNSAWGSNYSTFESSGNAVSGESIGTGDGSTVSFSHTLSKLTPSAHSVQILVNGTPVAGDVAKGVIYGPTLDSTSTINYTTGLLQLTFSAGNAPPSGAAITVNYVQNGWGIGTGLMDEDGRISHQAWLGIDYMSLTDTNANVKTDLNNFLFSAASQYLGTCSTEIKKVLPNTLFLGPDSIGSWGAPARSQVLQAAAKYIDVLSGPGLIENSQAGIDYIGQYFGDKPIIEGQYRSANPDSAWSSVAVTADNIHEFATQQARGQAYYNDVTNLLSLAYTSTGSHPFVGASWWQYTDNRSEQRNWGLVSLLDNAYDGHESVSATVSCSAPIQSFTCGGEAGNYGDVITQVRAANLYWLTH